MQGARLYRDTRVLNKLTTFYARRVHAPLQSMHSNQLDIIAKIHTKIYDNISLLRNFSNEICKVLAHVKGCICILLHAREVRTYTES